MIVEQSKQIVAEVGKAFMGKDDIVRKVFTENGSSVFYVCMVDVTDSGDKHGNPPRE